MPAENHLVSVIIPAYNRGGYIAETIRSVIDQTYTEWELIIVDDGSTDDTREVVSAYLSERIKYFRIDHSGRLGKVRNFGIHKAAGTFIAFQDSDDLWRADKLEVQMALLAKHPAAAFIIGNGDEFGVNFIQTPDYIPLFVGSLFIPVLQYGQFCFYVPTFTFRREVIDEIGLLSENDSTLHDITFFFRMSWRYTGIFSNERLVKIRKHARNTSAQNNVIAYINTLPMLKEFYDSKMIGSKRYRYLRGVCNYAMGLAYLHSDKPADALRAFLHYNFGYPLQYKGYIRLAQAVAKSIQRVYH